MGNNYQNLKVIYILILLLFINKNLNYNWIIFKYNDKKPFETCSFSTNINSSQQYYKFFSKYPQLYNYIQNDYLINIFDKNYNFEKYPCLE